MSEIPVFVNGARCEVEAGSAVLVAVRKWNAEAANELERGARTLTDSRGLPLDPGTIAVAGTIVRVVTAREARAESEELG